MGSFTYQTVLLVLIGAAVFVLGTTSMRACFRRKRPGHVFSGKVLHVKLIEKRDKEDRLIQHYYEMVVQCQAEKKIFNHKLNSTREYQKGDQIMLTRNNGKIQMLSSGVLSLKMSFLIALAGMALAVFPVVYQNMGERPGSAILVLLFILSGLILISPFLKDRRSNLTEIRGEITDVLYYKRGENKKLVKAVESYYPLIHYTVGEKETTFLSSYNSSLKTAYKPGGEVKLFYNEDTGEVIEKKASPLLAAAAVLLWALALLGLVSIFSY